MMKMSKRLLSIVLTGIMVMSVFTAWVPAAMSACTTAGGANANEQEVAATAITEIYIGETVNITGLINGSVVFSRTDPDNTFSISRTGTYARKKITTADVATTETGNYNMSYDSGTNSATVLIENPVLDIDLVDANGISITSVTKGTAVTIDTSACNMRSNAVLKVKYRDPTGYTTTDDTVTYANLSNYQLDTTDWRTGEHEIWVETVEECSYGLDLTSATETVTVYEAEITAEADNDNPVVNDEVLFTIQAPPYTFFNGTFSKCGNIETTNKQNNIEVGNNWTCGAADATFDATTDENGQFKFVLIFNESTTYTLEVWFGAATYAAASTDNKDKLEVDVNDNEVELDHPALVTIGAEFTIEGTALAGTTVDLSIDDFVDTGGDLDDIEIGTDGTFSVEIDTTDTAMPSALKIPGSVRIEAFVDRDQAAADEDTSDEDADGSSVLLLILGTLAAELSTNSVASGDEFTLSGTAPGTTDVQILTVPPKGGGGDPLTGTGALGLDVGLTLNEASVRDDDTFEEDLEVHDDADTGTYLVAALSPGRDGNWGNTGQDDIIFGLGVYLGFDVTDANFVTDVVASLQTKSMDDIVAILVDFLGGAGSGDLYVVIPVVVEEQKLTIDTPIADCPVGDDLVITGTSNREAGRVIMVTVKGPVELTPQTAIVANGTWTATFDTSSAEVGVYTVKADDGDKTVTVSVNVVTEAVPTEEPTETVTPDVTDVPLPDETEATPDETEATPEPTEEPPGFEAIFAIAGLFAVAFLVARRRE